MVKYHIRNGKSIDIPRNNEYSIAKGTRIIANIPDYLENPRGVANGIVKILNNQSKIILPDGM
jgi:hypothetical protein